MICKNCESQISDGSKICPVCGAVVNPDTNAAGVQKSVDEISKDTASAGKKKKGIIIAVIAAVLLAVIGVVIWLLVGRSAPDEETPEFDIKEKTVELVENVSEPAPLVLETVEDVTNSRFNKEINVRISAEDQVFTLLKQFVKIDIDVREVTGKIRIASQYPNIEADIELYGDGEELVKGSAVLWDGKLYISVPGLFTEVGEFDISSAFKGADIVEFEEWLKASAPSGDTARKIIKKYAEKFARKCVEDFKCEGTEFTVEGVTAKASLLSCEINSEKIRNALKELLDEAKADEEVAGIYDSLDELINIGEKDNIVNDLKEKIDQKLVFEGNAVYELLIDPEGDVVGGSLKINGIEFGFRTAKNDGKFGFTAYENKQDGKVFEVHGKGTYDGDKYTGSLTYTDYNRYIDAENDEKGLASEGADMFTVDFEDFDFSDLLDLSPNGKISVPLDQNLTGFGNLKISAEFNCDEKVKKVTVIPKMGELKLGEIVIEITDTDDVSVSGPEGDTAKYDINNIGDWVKKKINIIKAAELAKKIGLDIADIINLMK